MPQMCKMGNKVQDQQFPSAALQHNKCRDKPSNVPNNYPTTFNCPENYYLFAANNSLLFISLCQWCVVTGGKIKLSSRTWPKARSTEVVWCCALICLYCEISIFFWFWKTHPDSFPNWFRTCKVTGRLVYFIPRQTSNLEFYLYHNTVLDDMSIKWNKRWIATSNSKQYVPWKQRQ